MTRRSSTEAFADAMSSLVGDRDDVADDLARLVTDCAEVMSAGTVALLALDSHQRLALLSAASHAAVQMEMLQIQSGSGPCVDALEEGQALCVAGREAIAARWGDVGERIVAAGYGTVEAYPMRWRGEALGGLNVFRADETVSDPTTRRQGQAFADIAMLLVVRDGTMSSERVAARMHEALSARDLVEQAKGVLAELHGLGLEDAYGELLRRSADSGIPLTRTAQTLIQEQYEKPRR